MSLRLHVSCLLVSCAIISAVYHPLDNRETNFQLLCCLSRSFLHGFESRCVSALSGVRRGGLRRGLVRRRATLIELPCVGLIKLLMPKPKPQPEPQVVQPVQGSIPGAVVPRGSRAGVRQRSAFSTHARAGPMPLGTGTRSTPRAARGTSRARARSGCSCSTSRRSRPGSSGAASCRWPRLMAASAHSCRLVPHHAGRGAPTRLWRAARAGPPQGAPLS